MASTDLRRFRQLGDPSFRRLIPAYVAALILPCVTRQLQESATDRPATVPRAATLGLFFAWAVHDLEEALTFPGFTRRMARRVPWMRQLSREHVTVAITAMGLLVAAAAAGGAATGGRSRFYRSALTGFGWHAVGHLASAVALREYTPGAVTAGLVALPFWMWARRRLSAAGVAADDRQTRLAAVLLVPAALLMAHGTAWVVTSIRSRLGSDGG